MYYLAIEDFVVNPIHLTNELVHQNEFHILVHAEPVMCLLVSILDCGQNIGEQYPVMKW